MRFRSRSIAIAFCLALVAVFFSNCGSRLQLDEPPRHRKAPPTIVFLSDFGTANDAVAICKAVILQIVPDARIMDITHQVTPFSISEGARFLAGVTPYYPAGTVFLAVVDPGVGTSRKAIVAKSNKGQLFVLPNNGLITPVAERDGLAGVREITNPAWMMGERISSTFHGRDVFSPVAAHLAAGEDWILAGPSLPDFVRLRESKATLDEQGLHGEVIGLDDPFGSLITNIASEEFTKLGYAVGEKVTLLLGRQVFTMPYARTFMDVPVAKPLVYIDSRGRVGIALNQRDFAKAYKISPPLPITIRPPQK
jgi:S-adenosylmethionine hydrolase